MSAFEVTVTPPRGGQPKRRTESREPTLVMLGPFTPKATVIFEGVPVGKTARRQLVVRNPYDGEIKVLVTKIPKPEVNLSLEWTSSDIATGDERMLDLVWSPSKLLAIKEVLQMSDSCGNRKEITLIMKSIELKKAAPAKKNAPKVAAAPVMPKLRLKLKSPSPPKAAVRRSVLNRKKESPAKVTMVAPMPPKVAALKSSNASNIFSSSAFNFSQVSEGGRRSEKENQSPGTPDGASKLFNSIKFTPSNGGEIADLADLPTPVNFLRVDDFRFENIASIRKRLSISPEVKLAVPSNESVLALKATPEVQIYKAGSPGRGQFDPNCFSTVSKPPEPERTYLMVNEVTVTAEKDSGARQLNFSHDLELTEIVHMKDSPLAALKAAETVRAVDRVSPCNEIQLVFLEQLEAAFSEQQNPQQPKVLNKTQTVSPYCTSPQLSMIAEESLRDLGVTYAASAAPETTHIHQKTFKIASHESLVKSTSDDNIVKNLTLELARSRPVPPTTPGSMPNLNEDVDDDDEARHIFKEHEIRAQSSRFNLHEVGRVSDEMNQSAGKRRHHLDRTDYDEEEEEEEELCSMVISPPKRSKMSAMSLGRMAPPPPKARTAVRQSLQVTKSTASTRPLSLKRPVPAAPTLALARKLPSEEKRIFLYDSDQHLKTFINPDPFAATTTCDPFLSVTMYLDERAFERYERQLKKWLNALVTIPADLDTESNKPLDVGKLFDEVKGKQLTLAPTKELISCHYYRSRLEQLRNAGYGLYTSEQVAGPLRKVRSAIEKKSMVLRTDRDLHLDLVLQRTILELLLCFNPLWLRLGLEVTYGELIELQSNRDIVGLSTFIVNRLFRDRYEEAKGSKAYSLSPAYAEYMKKFTFQKFLFLLFFLDTAKNSRLIRHNPCLFVKNAPYKETREILIRFASHLIAGIGDITKHLKRFGYVLTHKQTFLDEFDYAFENLGVDLRDGIRLTRVMEIILLRDDLTQNLRVPSISRLQKIHNVNLALRALEEAEYQITGDITAKDICDGHREKTLSLLWQIVYKFRAPKFNAAANVIRGWWRKNWLRVVIARRIEEKRVKMRERAAVRIQAVWRRFRTRQWFRAMREEKLQAVVILQKYTRRYLAQKQAAQQYSSILRIQRWWRSIQQMRTVRSQYLLQRRAALLVQTSFRRFALARRILAASTVIRTIKAEALRRHQSAIVLQRVLRSYVVHRKLQAIVGAIVAFNRKKAVQYRAAARIQAMARMVVVRREFVRLRSATIVIQQRWRECLLARRQRCEFVELRQSAIVVQQRFRGLLLMRQVKTEYEVQRSRVIFVQRKVRAKLETRRVRGEFVQLRQSAVIVQRRFRALIAMRQQRASYQDLRSAAIVLQQRFRARCDMKVQSTQFLRQRTAAQAIQRRFRANLAMREQRGEFHRLRAACITIQHHLRATIAMKRQRVEFLSLQYSVMVVQRQFRANVAARRQREEYVTLRSSAINVQRRWRATLLARDVQRSYQLQRQAAITIQRYWRNVQLRRMTRENYLEKRCAAVKIQRHFRGYLLMKRTRAEFNDLKRVAITVQRRYRATKSMQLQLVEFERMVWAARVVQVRFRARQIASEKRAEFEVLRKVTLCVQRQRRAMVAMRRDREAFLKLREAVISVQQRFRALVAMKEARGNYLRIYSAVICIQRRYRAEKESAMVHGQYLNLRSATIVIQQYFRGYLEMKREKTGFERLKSAAVRIQQQLRAVKQMRVQRESFQKQRSAAIAIQRYFRGYLSMKKQRAEFLQVRRACLVVQRRYRAKQAMIEQKIVYDHLRTSAITIQQRWRATLTMRRECSDYRRVQWAVQIIQTRYRACCLRWIAQLNYRIYRSAVIVVQRRFRANLLMKSEMTRYQRIKTVTLRLQTRCRGYLAREAFQAKLTPEYLERRQREQAAKRIQACWRGYRHRKRHQTTTMRDIALRMIASRREALRDPSNNVTNILRSCLKFMHTRFAVHEAIKVLQRIEYMSRLVPHLLASDAIFLATFCYATMAQAIRSELDKQLIEICARIILNLARFNGTKEQAFQENGLVTVSQMLLRWCDKECAIFNTLCTLLWVLSHDRHKKNAIRRYMISREAIYMLRETKKLVQRKENMRRNVKKPPVGCLVPPDPTLMRMVPILGPDYGVIRSQPYVFYSSVFAFDTVLAALDVDIS
ncbi:protein abnormal spindle-like [Culex pipiens pallens]|uniref:protein abnormal spindle-like n=1 Tax=Culex pipiens pallens TaxID=42434 RepID=UPI001954B503|nr:protein abnormal spindle-like [Culex pipiens pallens]